MEDIFGKELKPWQENEKCSRQNEEGVRRAEAGEGAVRDALRRLADILV